MARTGPLLSTQIALVFDAFDRGEESAIGDLKSLLMPWIKGAEALESGQCLAQAEGQIATLESKVAALNKENENLKTEANDLQSLLEQATFEVARMKEEQNPKKRSDVEEQIMMTLLNGEKLPSHRIAYHLRNRTPPGIGKDVADVRLHDLVQNGFVEEIQSEWDPGSGHSESPAPKYGLTTKGKRYLLKRGLIQ